MTDRPRDRVFLEGVELYGYIGVFPEERREGQTFYLDVELALDLKPAGKSDALAQTVNYAEVFSLAEQLMEEARCELIETYAEQLAEEIFAYFDSVHWVKVTVRKPQAPMEGTFRAVGISIERHRND